MSYQKTDKKALYVRMLGDMKTQVKPELTKECIKVHVDSVASAILQTDVALQRTEEGLFESMNLSLRLPGSQEGRARKRYYSSSSLSGSLIKKEESQIMPHQQKSDLLDTHYSVQAMTVLSTVNMWTFNVFTLHQLTNGRSLFHIALHLFNEYGFIEMFQLDVLKLMRCFSLVEFGYYVNNPYHNAMHAADVVQAMHCNLLETKMAQYLQPEEKMAAILSAAGHDLYHPGVNQSFLVATENPLAALYQNSSVLENHHWQSLVTVFHETKIFDHLPIVTWLKLKTQIRALILATDITQQHVILTAFRQHLDAGSLNLQSNDEHRTFILQIALKCADICNPCRPWPLSQRWSELICQEFFRQGDWERQLALPVGPYCDRNLTTVAKIQKGFITFIVEPLFCEWSRYTTDVHTTSMWINLRANKEKWNSIIGNENLAAVSATPILTLTQGSEDRDSSLLRCDEDCSDKENDDITPPLSDTPPSVSDIKSYSQYRRHSLPTDSLVLLDPIVLPSKKSKSARRFSLPTSVVFPVPSGSFYPPSADRKSARLAALVEHSLADDDVGTHRLKRCGILDVRRSSLNDANISYHKSTQSNGGYLFSTTARRHSDFAQTLATNPFSRPSSRRSLASDYSPTGGQRSNILENTSKGFDSDYLSKIPFLEKVLDYSTFDRTKIGCRESNTQIRRFSLAACPKFDSSPVATANKSNNRIRSSSLIISTLQSSERLISSQPKESLVSWGQRLGEYKGKRTVSPQHRFVKTVLFTSPDEAAKESKYNSSL